MRKPTRNFRRYFGFYLTIFIFVIKSTLFCVCPCFHFVCVAGRSKTKCLTVQQYPQEKTHTVVLLTKNYIECSYLVMAFGC